MQFKLTCHYPDFSQAVRSDSTVMSKLKFLVIEEISLRFRDSVQVVRRTKAEPVLQKF